MKFNLRHIHINPVPQLNYFIPLPRLFNYELHLPSTTMTTGIKSRQEREKKSHNPVKLKCISKSLLLAITTYERRAAAVRTPEYPTAAVIPILADIGDDNILSLLSPHSSYSTQSVSQSVSHGFQCRVVRLNIYESRAHILHPD